MYSSETTHAVEASDAMLAEQLLGTFKASIMSQILAFNKEIPDFPEERTTSVPELPFPLPGSRLSQRTSTPFPISRLLEALERASIYRWTYKEIEKPRIIEAEVKQFVAEKFRKENQVLAIYTSKYLDEIRFIVLLENEVYDEDLMDRLLDIELEIWRTSKDVFLEFQYIPKVYSSEAEIIHPDSECIYRKA